MKDFEQDMQVITCSGLGHTLINQPTMAQQTAMRCQKKREKRASCPFERFDAADRSRFCVLEGQGEFDRQRRCKSLETGRFPAALRLVSEQIHPYHCGLIYEGMTYPSGHVFRRKFTLAWKQS
ncbi:hypothetical protein [Roseibium sp.]|uniref:hypothetical protein n=1 Tax=Roseibium sp. TaxID=1936156 RepID=UPI003B501A42